MTITRVTRIKSRAAARRRPCRAMAPTRGRIMQIRVNGSPGTPLPDYYNPTTLALLQSTLPVAYAATQERPIVAESAYNAAFGTSCGRSICPTFPRVHCLTQRLTLPMAAGLQCPMVPAYPKPSRNSLIRLWPDECHPGRGTAVYQRLDPDDDSSWVSSIRRPRFSRPSETQLWKITHNGVDTHPIHFHLFNVQVINRVGWDGMHQDRPTPTSWAGRKLSG